MKIFYFFLSIFFFLFQGILPAQHVVIDSLGKAGYPIHAKWLFNTSDKSDFKNPDFSDSTWNLIDARLIDTVDFSKIKGVCWFRLHISVGESLKNVPLAFEVIQTGASEIYFDGELIGSFGNVSADENKEVKETAQGMPVFFNYSPQKEHVLAIRYSNHNAEVSYTGNGVKMGGFELIVEKALNATEKALLSRTLISSIGFSLSCFYLVLGFVHLLIWFFYKKNKGNLYYFFFALNLAVFPFCVTLVNTISNMDTISILNLIIVFAFPLIFISLLNLVYHFFYENFPKRFKWYIVAGVLVSIWNFFDLPLNNFLNISFPITVTIDTLFTVVIAVKRRKRGSKIIAAGILFFAGFVLLSLISVILASAAGTIINLGDSALGIAILILMLLAMLSIPVSMSVFLAQDFALTNKSLLQKLEEVEMLSAKSIEQEKEKQRILENQKEKLELQVIERTSEITEQKKVIEEKNKDITDSILYAKKIQDAMLPAADVTLQLFPSSFILFQPKDIVSGDFYWLSEIRNFRFIAAADCTGHGVPGALMSMTGNNLLNQLVNERNLNSTKEILIHLDEAIRKSLKQERADVESKDGMDIALCRFNSDFSELLFSGANRPLWMIRENEIIEYKPVKKSIGGTHSGNDAEFTEVKIALMKNDFIYLFSDGFADQFGGPEGKKFMTKQLKKVLLDIHQLPVAQQKSELEKSFSVWKNNLEQVDDVLIIGIKI
ncbi:hypothetical protein BH09BAC5_BH09BAC5_16500 [soil metagenome]